MAPGGRVAIVEFVPNEDRVSPPMPAMFAYIMLATTPGGTSFPPSALKRMLAQAGFGEPDFAPLPPSPQTLVVARELDHQAPVLIAEQPTRGVDVGAIEFIHAQLVAERDKGRAVLLVSAELGEILALSDRVLVMYEGRVIAEVSGTEATETGLGLLMAGVTGSAA